MVVALMTSIGNRQEQLDYNEHEHKKVCLIIVTGGAYDTTFCVLGAIVRDHKWD